MEETKIVKENKGKKKNKALIAILIFTIIIAMTNVALVVAKGVDYYLTYSTVSSLAGDVKYKGKGNVGDFVVECKKGVVNDGVLTVGVSFKNVSDKAVSFDSVIDIEAYQDGIQLASAGLDDYNSAVKIKPNKTIEFEKTFTVNKDKESVDVEFYLSGSDESSLIVELK